MTRKEKCYVFQTILEALQLTEKENEERVFELICACIQPYKIDLGDFPCFSNSDSLMMGILDIVAQYNSKEPNPITGKVVSFGMMFIVVDLNVREALYVLNDEQ